MGVIYILGGALLEEVWLGKWSGWMALGGHLSGYMVWWGCGMGRFRLVHCLVEVRVGELDPRQCLVEGSLAFAVAALCAGALLCSTWSVPDVRYSDGG